MWIYTWSKKIDILMNDFETTEIQLYRHMTK